MKTNLYIKTTILSYPQNTESAPIISGVKKEKHKNPQQIATNTRNEILSYI